MQNVWIVGAAGQSEVPAEPVRQSNQTVAVVDANTSGKAVPAKSPSPYPQLILIVGVFVIMYFILFREPRKRQKQQQKLVQALKKNDKVRTIGGIIGTVVDVKDDEVVLKIDEANNTKIRVVASAIGKNLSTEGQ